MFPGVHIELVGAVLEKTLGASSTAKHSAAERQLSAVRWLERSVDTVPLHGAFNGAVIEKTLVPLSTATHTGTDWQVSVVSAWLEESDRTGDAHVNGAAACAALAAIPAAHSATAEMKTLRRACPPAARPTRVWRGRSRCPLHRAFNGAVIERTVPPLSTATAHEHTPRSSTPCPEVS